MKDACLFQLMDIPEPDLKRILPKASTRVIIRLITAYPRSIGRTLLLLLEGTMSAATLDFLREQMHSGDMPSYGQIREAEREFFKLLSAEHLVN